VQTMRLKSYVLLKTFNAALWHIYTIQYLRAEKFSIRRIP
jgi:hypothetical protein